MVSSHHARSGPFARRLVAGVAAAAWGGVAACSGDSNSPPAETPANVAIHAGDNGEANAGTSLTPRPAVRVVGASGNGVPGVEVTFTEISGGGAVNGGIAETDANGVATVGGWTMGTLGTNTLRASVQNLAPVTFTAQSNCGTIGTLTLGVQINGTLAATDCEYPDGDLTDRYVFTTTTQRAVRFDESSTAFDSFVELFSGNRLVAFNDDFDASLNSRMTVILAPGTYHVGASTFEADVGAYSLLGQSASESASNCDFFFAMPGTTSTQALESTDCFEDTGDIYSDLIDIFLTSAHAYTITMSSGAFATHLELVQVLEDDFDLVATSVIVNATTSHIVYTPTTSGHYILVARERLPRSAGAGPAFGAYTLAITP
jgi:hypothetical protein